MRRILALLLIPWLFLPVSAEEQKTKQAGSLRSQTLSSSGAEGKSSENKSGEDKSGESKSKVPLKDISGRDLTIRVDPEDLKVRGKHGVRIYVKNNSDRAVMFSGDKATATVHGTEYSCMNLGEFDDLSGSQPTFMSKLDSNTADTGSTVLSSSGLQSVKDLLKSHKPVLNRFSKERAPQPNDSASFGQRILWPGDSSSGTIIFPSSEALGGAVIKIPVTSFFDSADLAIASNEKNMPGSAGFQPVSSKATGAETTVPFEYRGGHLICVPVRLNDSIDSKFILDTGAGVNLISDKLAQKLGLKPFLSHSGKRMSGQLLKMKMGRMKSLRFGCAEEKNVFTAVWKLEDLFGKDKSFADVGGILSLNYFRKVPFTIDYKRKLIVLETKESLKERKKKGNRSRIKVESKLGLECSIKVPMSIAKFPKLMAEVDTGSDSLILDYRYLRSLNIRSAEIKRVYGKDETGHSYMRYFSKLPGKVWVKDAPAIAQEHPQVMFQKIIHDGLLGDSFLKQFTVSFDLEHAEMIFAK